jgi:hypothetical protein
MAAEIANTILRAHREPFDWITVEEMTRARVDEDAVVGAVSSLFGEPIRWVRPAGYLAGGQHRVCALKHAAVVAVVVGAA